MIKQRRFTYEPRLLWASAIHRRVGALASIAGMVAATSGAIGTGFGRKAFLDPLVAAAAQSGSETMVGPVFTACTAPAALSSIALVGGLLYSIFGQLWAASSEWRAAASRKSLASRPGIRSKP